MPSIKLTKKTVEDLAFAPPGTQIAYVDSILPGFGVRVSARVKTYYAEKRVNGRTVRVTLGRHGQITCELARKRAQSALGEMSMGANPNALKKAGAAAAVTLKEAFVEFARERKTLKPSTLRSYEGVMRLAFRDWQDRPLTFLSKDLIAARHAP